jgi:hypothetical protein
VLAASLGYFNYMRVVVWHAFVRAVLRRYCLNPPVEEFPEGYASRIGRSSSEHDEEDPSPFADTDIISSRIPERRNAAPDALQSVDEPPRTTGPQSELK